MVSELYQLSKQYLRQETLGPAKRLGRYAGMGVGAGLLFALAAIFGVVVVYGATLALLPEGEWWTVLSRGITTVVAALLAWWVGGRMSN